MSQVLAPLDNRYVKASSVPLPNIWQNQPFICGDLSCNTLYVNSNVDVSSNIAFTGQSGSLSINYKASKNQNLVVLSFEGSSFTKTGSGVLTSTTPVPISLLPTTASFAIQDGTINGNISLIGFSIQPSGIPQQGVVSIYNASSATGNFANNDVVVFRKTSLCYSV
jgi:hypothetical protein